MLFVNWSEFSGNQQLETIRCMYMFIIFFIIVINLMMTIGQVTWAQVLGSAFTGIFYGLAAYPRKESVKGHKKSMIGLMLLFSWFTLWGLLFFLQDLALFERDSAF